jgi:predicted component of type VI protein secretion system
MQLAENVIALWIARGSRFTELRMSYAIVRHISQLLNSTAMTSSHQRAS